MQNAPGTVTQSHQGSQAFPHQRSVRLQRRTAIDHGHSLPVLGLIDCPVVANEEAAFADVSLWRRGFKDWSRFILNCRCLHRERRRWGEFGQAANRILESPGKIAVAGDAVAFAVEGVLAGPGAKDHFGMVQKVAIDGNVLAVDGKWSHAQPVGINMICRFASGAFA